MIDLSWPLWTLELSPSSGTAESYPLEVGVACWPSPDAAITTWSTPISPIMTTDWNEPRQAYLERSGLVEEDLIAGMTPHDVAMTLNDIFMTSIVYGRGGTVDVHLAHRLNLAAKIWPTYSLSNWEELCDRDDDRHIRAKEIARQWDSNVAQRACHIMQGIAHMLDRKPSSRSVPTMAVSLPI